MRTCTIRVDVVILLLFRFALCAHTHTKAKYYNKIIEWLEHAQTKRKKMNLVHQFSFGIRENKNKTPNCVQLAHTCFGLDFRCVWDLKALRDLAADGTSNNTVYLWLMGLCVCVRRKEANQQIQEAHCIQFNSNCTDNDTTMNIWIK